MEPITVKREEVVEVASFKTPMMENIVCKICKRSRADYVRYFTWRKTMLLGDNLRVPVCHSCGKDTDLLMDFVIYHFIQRANGSSFRDIY